MKKKLNNQPIIGCRAHIAPTGAGWAREQGTRLQSKTTAHHNPPLSPSPTPPLPRSGLTFIDLLVSMGVIAVLIALLLPAVQSAREAARRMHCENNLSQINIALQNYAFAFGTFPPGTVNATGPIKLAPSKDAYHVSWTVQILPQLELETVQNHFDFQEGVYDLRNLSPQQRVLELLICPSSANPNRLGQRGVSHYAGVHASTAVPIDIDNDGILFLNSRIRPADITDGTSNTLIVGEHGDPNMIWGWASGTSDTLRNTGYLMNFALMGAGTTLPGVVPGPEEGLISDADLQAERIPDAYGYGLAPGFQDIQEEGIKIPDPKLVPRGFSSSHTGGAQFACSDGSVKFLSENIGVKIFQQIASRNDGSMPEDF